MTNSVPKARKFFQSSPRLSAAAHLIFASLALFTFFRILFFGIFTGKNASPIAPLDILQAFFLGLRFDLRLAILLALPLLILGMFRPLHWQCTSLHRRLWAVVYSALYGFVVLTYMADIGYYAYLESRINYRVFEFFKNVAISAEMVYETYNLWLWGPAYLIALFGVHQYFQRKIFVEAEGTRAISKPKLVLVAQSIFVLALIVLGVHSRLGQYPLRWSDAFFTQNMFVANLAMNPVHYIFDTAKNSKRDFSIEKVKNQYPKMAAYLGVSNPDTEKLSFVREIPQTPRFTTRPNIVYIVMESMAAYKTGVFGNGPDSSPTLDQLAKSGWLFRHFYTPTEGTARSMFCLLTGVPDINAKSTSSRNPLIINQHTLINGLTDYERMYFIGGSAAWGNIRGVYVNNVDNLKMYEDTDLSGPRTDVWGLSDLDLFRESARILRERSTDKPFFALIQTASFHRPYTIPPEHGDFETKTLSDSDLKKYGFASNEEYNSFRFSDYSLGEFFRLIKDDRYFANTIFVIHGDHGLPHNNAEHLKEGYKSFGLNRFHTPLVIFSPLIDKPEEFELMMSQADVWPTLLGLTGHQYPNQALGRNIFALPKAQPNYAFSYVYYTSPLQIMLYDQEHMVFGTEDRIESLHLYNSTTPSADVKDQYPDKFNEMRDLLQGIFESSKYILHHNQRRE